MSTTATPTRPGYFGDFGGVFVPETLIAALHELEAAYNEARADDAFQAQLADLLKHYVGRPTPLYFAQRLTERIGGAKIYLKREDLAHTGAHKINNTIGQALLTVRMGKKRIIAETGAGQHGVATATAAALLGLECDVYMGVEDMRRQRPNVVRMNMLGARCIGVASGSKTLKDATNEAMRDWMGSVEHTHYIIGSVVGPHPFPTIVRDFQAIIGCETHGQCREQFGRMPDLVVACVGGGSNAAGIFAPLAPEESVQLLGVEAGGENSDLGHHAAPLSFGSPGVLHGSRSYVLQDPDGQTAKVHSISAGLDYPGVGPEHSHWHDTGRVQYTTCTDKEALAAFQELCAAEGIIPALETSHALHVAMQRAKQMDPERIIVVNLSGRGDKDVDEVARVLDMA